MSLFIFSSSSMVFCSSAIKILISTSGLNFKLSNLFLSSNLRVLMFLVEYLFKILHNWKAVLFDLCTMSWVFSPMLFRMIHFVVISLLMSTTLVFLSYANVLSNLSSIYLDRSSCISHFLNFLTFSLVI